MKKSMLFHFLTVLAVVFAFSSSAAMAKAIKFAVSSDAHYSAKNFSDSERDLSKTSRILGGFVDRVNENDYDFVVFLGDNIDKSNKENLNGFLKAVQKIKTPYYLVMGNHDVHKISGMEKKVYLDILSENSKYQRKARESYYFYPSSDVIVIVLDNVSSGMPSAHGIFSPKTVKWLEEVLTKNKNKKALIFQHVPYITPYENKSHEILDKTDYRAVLSRHDNVLAVFAGHYHKEGTIRDDKGIIHVNAPAMCVEPYYYMEMSLEYDKMPFQKAKNFKLDGTVKPAI